MLSAILTLTPFPRAHLSDLGGHDLKTADASGLIAVQRTYFLCLSLLAYTTISVNRNKEFPSDKPKHSTFCGLRAALSLKNFKIGRFS